MVLRELRGPPRFAASHSAAPERVAPLEETRGVAAASAPMAAVPPAGVKVRRMLGGRVALCFFAEEWDQLSWTAARHFMRRKPSSV